jgi:sorbitol/mannitol transport system substrate-binding protein
MRMTLVRSARLMRSFSLGASALAIPLLAQGVALHVATVNNGHMITLQKLSAAFERSHPDIQLKWVTLEEGALRQQVTRDITTKGAQFDVVTVGSYEAGIWGRKGWLTPLTPSPAYDLDDLLPPIRAALSVDQRLYALPFYGESSMTLVRSDLLKAAGINLGNNPSWDQIKAAARQLHQPDKGVYGICLRGKPGWGENMSLITTMVNTHGGQWFDMSWRPQLNTAPWRNAVKLYVDLLRHYGPPGAAANGYNENLALFMSGRCAIWVDATVAGAFVNQTDSSKVAGKVAFLPAPVATTPKGAHWLWTWALAIPATSSKAPAAQAFIEWATSKDYIKLVAIERGWSAVPSGTRASTYESAAFRRTNPHAEVERQAIATANPHDATLPPSPYVGVQWAGIPEFQSIGTAVGQQISQLLDDGQVDETLAKAQQMVERKMRAAGYGR